MRTSLRAAALLGAAPLLAAPARADITYNSFSSTAGLSLQGAAAQAGNRLRVCPAVANLAGSAWYTTRQDVTAPFTTELRFQMGGGADGMAFVIQRDSQTALGGAAEQLGYHGLSNCIAIELDTWQNLNTGDPNANHLSVHTTGAGVNSVNELASIGATTLVVDLNDNAEHTLRVEYAPGSLRIFVDDLAVPALTVPVDIGATLNLSDDTAWVGFTAGTGSVWQAHDVLSWSFDENAATPSGNTPPDAPPINEPTVNGAVVNPYDVHMEAGPFSDLDGDGHLCSDWEIWTMSPTERVWRTSCISGPAIVHTHLGDGVFQGSHAGQAELDTQTAYVLRVRFRDDSGDAWTEWGAWSEREFQTGAASTFYPFVADDLVDDPAPEWTFTAGGGPVVLPASNPQPTVALESAFGDLLLSFSGLDNLANTVVNPGQLPAHVDVRLRVQSGGAALSLPETDLEVVDHECQITRVLLPAINLGPNSTALYWVSFDGSTWVANAGQTEPDFSTLARGLALPWVVSTPGYQVEVVATGFTLPVDIAFVPNPGPNPGDPLFYVSELYGQIKVVRNDGSVGTYASNLLNYNPGGAFPGSGEQGLSGLAVDPVTGDVFANMLYAQGSPHYPKVVRFQSLDGGNTASNQTTILDMNGESQGQSHFISNLEMLPDGTLLVHMGDGFNSGTAQDLSSFRGKILRINQDGTAPTNNPLYNGNPITARDYVYAYGVRNPFGGSRRASDGFQYCVENGPVTDRLTRIVPGQNYLWNGSNNSMFNFAIYDWTPAHGPVDMAWIQPESFGGSGFPASKNDHVFVTESGPTYASGPQTLGKRIVEFVIDGQGNLVSGPETLVEYAGTGRATCTGIAAGPDGLYFCDLYKDQGGNPTASGANVLRVRHVGASLGTCGLVGDTFCSPAVPNSTGLPATIVARGSDAVADNDLTLEAQQLPTNQFTYFITSLTQGFTSGPGGSQGDLCLGGQIGRFVAQVQNTGLTGSASISVDVANLPPPLSSISAGDTWSYQAWYRDMNPGSTSNFTDGVVVTFR
jgi:glucose/arabinose dehydrogenase